MVRLLILAALWFLVVSAVGCSHDEADEPDSGPGTTTTATSAAPITAPAPTTEAPTTTTEVPKATTEPSSASTEAPPTTTATVLVPEEPSVLVAGEEELILHTADASWVVLETPDPVRLAYPDHRGSVVYQLDTPFDEPAPIFAFTPGETGPTVIVPDDAEADLWLHTVAVIDGTPTMVYVSSYFICDVTNDCASEVIAHDLVLMDLDTGAIDNLGMIASWDEFARSTSYGGGLLAHSWSAELDYPFVVFRNLTSDREPHPSLCDIDQSQDYSYVCSHISLSPDGTRLATFGDPCFVGPWSTATARSCPPEVRVYDVATGDTATTLSLATPADSPLWLDADASHILATTGTGVWVLGYDGTLVDTIEFDTSHAGRAVIWAGPLPQAMTLRADGLGVVSFGDPMDDAVATLTDLLGTPSGDRVVEAPFGEEGEMGGGTMACWTATGTTCIDYLRVVSWDAIGLFAVFSDWIESDPAGEDWEPAPAPRNLRGYAYFGGPGHLVLSTEGGVTIGSTVDDLVEAYGGYLRFSFDQCAFNVAGFEVVAPAGNGGHDGHNSNANWGLWGELSGVPDEAETVVTSIGGGTLLGHC